MKKLPYFSIIVPIYNTAAYLEQCVKSVLDQSFTDFELILVNDGSTDNSAELCDGFAASDSRVRVLHKPNGGLSSARNEGFKIAAGNYIWWVDSDDWTEPGALQKLWEATADSVPDMVKFNHYRSASEREFCRSTAEPGVYSTEAELELLRNAAFFRTGKFCLSVWSHIYRREFLQAGNLTFVSERVVGSEDYLFNLQAYPEAVRVVVLTDAFYDYRLREGSLTQGYRKELLKRYTELYLQLRQRYDRMGRLEQYEGKLSRFYVWHLIHGTGIGHEYRNTRDHTRQDGRRTLKEFFANPVFIRCVRSCDRTGLTTNERIQLWAMRWGIEPLFYWLYVIKPRLKKG